MCKCAKGRTITEVQKVHYLSISEVNLWHVEYIRLVDPLAGVVEVGHNHDPSNKDQTPKFSIEGQY